MAKPQPDVTDPEILLKQRFQVEELKDAEAVFEGKERADEASKALIVTDSGDKRVAVIKSGSYEYYFNTLQPVPLDETQDQTIARIIESFRRAEARDFPSRQGLHDLLSSFAAWRNINGFSSKQYPGKIYRGRTKTTQWILPFGRAPARDLDKNGSVGILCPYCRI